MNNILTALSLENIQYHVGSSANLLNILNSVNLKVNKGESIAIMGSSGCGKTTLLNIMAGLLKPSAGSIYAENQALHLMTIEQATNWRRIHSAFIFQSFELLDNLSAVENVMLPLELKNMPEPQKQAKHFLTKVGLADRFSHYPHMLSGGEQQRVAIARAFATKPSILFADEPTGNLDEKTGQLITKLLFELNQQTTTLILVTHDSELAKQCQKAYRLVGGELLCL